MLSKAALKSRETRRVELPESDEEKILSRVARRHVSVE
jgi:hypothetical protein